MNKKAKQVAGAVKGQSKKLIGVTAASLVISSTLMTANAAYQGDRNVQTNNAREMRWEGVRGEAVQTALDDQNFEAWRQAEEAKGNTKILAVIDTQEEFNRLVEAHKLMRDGKRDEAIKLFQELGLSHKGNREAARSNVGLNNAEKDAVHAALQKGDYSTWKTLMEKRGGHILQYVNEGNFAQYAEAKQLQWEGKFTEAKQILDAIGLPFGERSGGYQNHQNGFKRGEHKNKGD